MSLRDNAFDIIPALGDLPYNAYYPQVRVAQIVAVFDCPVEWTTQPAPAPIPGTGSALPSPPIRIERIRRRSCVDVPAVYARHQARATDHVAGDVVLHPVFAGHRVRIVDPLPGLLADEDEALVLLVGAME